MTNGEPYILSINKETHLYYHFTSKYEQELDTYPGL